MLLANLTCNLLRGEGQSREQKLPVFLADPREWSMMWERKCLPFRGSGCSKEAAGKPSNSLTYSLSLGWIYNDQEPCMNVCTSVCVCVCTCHSVCIWRPKGQPVGLSFSNLWVPGIKLRPLGLMVKHLYLLAHMTPGKKRVPWIPGTNILIIRYIYVSVRWKVL